MMKTVVQWTMGNEQGGNLRYKTECGGKDTKNLVMVNICNKTKNEQTSTNSMNDTRKQDVTMYSAYLDVQVYNT